MCSFPKIVRKVMEFDFFGHEKSWNLNFQKEYEPCCKNVYNQYHEVLFCLSGFWLYKVPSVCNRFSVRFSDK